MKEGEKRQGGKRGKKGKRDREEEDERREEDTASVRGFFKQFSSTLSRLSILLFNLSVLSRSIFDLSVLNERIEISRDTGVFDLLGGVYRYTQRDACDQRCDSCVPYGGGCDLF